MPALDASLLTLAKKAKQLLVSAMLSLCQKMEHVYEYQWFLFWKTVATVGESL